MALSIRKMKNGDLAADGLFIDGSAAFLWMRAGDLRQVKINLKDYLGSSGTISSVEAIGSLTVSGLVAASGIITANITGPSGSNYADIKATLSTGEIVSQRIHARENSFNQSRDYAA